MDCSHKREIIRKAHLVHGHVGSGNSNRTLITCEPEDRKLVTLRLNARKFAQESIS